MMFPCILLLLLSNQIAAQWSGDGDYIHKALKKPIVIPAAESDYHYTMIAVDSEVVAQKGESALYAKIGVMLLDGLFTFSGVIENTMNYRKTVNSKPCHPFYGSGVVHMCDDEYFLVNSDHVHISRVELENTDKLDKLHDICKTKTFAELTKKVSGKELVAIGNRVLMTFKVGNIGHKCIGTYDIDDDMFSCMWAHKKDEVFVPVRVPGFLFNPYTGVQRVKTDRSVEVFCKFEHIFHKG